MVCNHFILETKELTDEATGRVIYLDRLVPNRRPYLVAIHRVETFFTRILTAGGRRSWVLNGVLNNSWFTPYYWRLKKRLFTADMVLYK